MKKVSTLKLSDPAFLRRVHGIVVDSSRMVITAHAKSRMIARRVSDAQVLQCLRKGHIVEPAHVSIDGDWKATVEHRWAGDMVKVAVEIQKIDEDGDYAVVVTVMN